MRPTYAMLLRHAWLAPLMKPPTISEDSEAEAAAEARADAPSSSLPEPTDSHPDTADKEIADWVQSAIERKLSGKMGQAGKPALHAAPLDAVPGSPLLDREALKLNTSITVPPGGQGQEASTNEVEETEVAEAAAAMAEAAAVADPEPKDGVTVQSPELDVEKVHSMDFADGVDGIRGEGEVESEKKSETADQAQAPTIAVDGAKDVAEEAGKEGSG